MTYKEFLENKRFVLESSGFDIDKSELNPMLYDFQKDIVRWALKKGKACIFADCGLGKMQAVGKLRGGNERSRYAGSRIKVMPVLWRNNKVR